MSVGGQVTSSPSVRQRSYTASTSSTRIHNQEPLSADWSPSGPKVFVEPRPRPPWPSTQRKISQSPEHTEPKSGGSPQSQDFCHPSLANHSTLSVIFDTFRMGVTRLAIMGRNIND